MIIVNQFVTQSEEVKMRTIDHIVSMVAYWLRASQGKSDRSDIRAKRRDFSDAYKQRFF